MLDNNPPAKPKNAILAGANAGVRVLCHDEAVLKQYNDIAHLARNGNYWAEQIASGITGLTSGRLHQDNVFVHKGKGALYGRGEFKVVLPGATATLEEQDTGELVLTSLVADTSYQAMQKNAEKPGLWEVKKKGDDWSNLKHIPDSKTTKIEKSQWIVISDRKDDHADAAISGGTGISDIHPLAANDIKHLGFKLHFTPGDGSIGGYKNCKQVLRADKCPKLHESALLLAQTIFQARDIENVRWMSDWGGSGVLTQALKILSDNKASSNIDLSKHSFYLNHPTTQPSKAVRLALDLGLDGSGITKKTGYMPSEVIGRMVMLDTPASHLTRLMHDKNYTGTNITGNAVSITTKATGLGLGAVGGLAAVGAITLSAPVAAGVGIGGAMLFAVGILNKGAKAAFPNAHKKISKKFT